jgi:hypothetical protein
MRRLVERTRNESGAALLLALVFVVVIAVIVGALVTLGETNLQDTSHLQNERATEYSADAAVEGAIQSIRHQSPPATCPTFNRSGAFTTNGSPFLVECQYAGTPAIVQFVACPWLPGYSSSDPGFVACQNSATLRAEVLYGEAGSSSSSYGSNVRVTSWVVKVANS